MNPAFRIGDKVMRTDYFDGEVYEIDQIREHRGVHIYHMLNQGWAQGWAWVNEWNIKKVNVTV